MYILRTNIEQTEITCRLVFRYKSVYVRSFHCMKNGPGVNFQVACLVSVQISKIDSKMLTF